MRNKLDYFENFKFLGIHIAKNGKLTIGVKYICQQAACAQTILDLHIIKHPSVLLQHIFELFDCPFKPVVWMRGVWC